MSENKDKTQQQIEKAAKTTKQVTFSIVKKVIGIKIILFVGILIIILALVGSIIHYLDGFDVTDLIEGISEGLPTKKSVQAAAISNGTSSSMEAAAKKIHDYIRENGYQYSLQVGGGFLPLTDDELLTNKYVCCATYVYWAAMEAGYKAGEAPIHGADSLANALMAIGFTEVPYSEIQPGDVEWFPGEHIQISAGVGQYYNAGSDNAIQTVSPPGSGMDSSRATILRAPSNGLENGGNATPAATATPAAPGTITTR